MQNYDDDLYLIDMSYLNSPAEFVYDLTSVLNNEQAQNKRLKIKIGNIELNQAQLMSIKSLVQSVNSSLVVLDGTSDITRASALATGIVYENSGDMLPSETAFINEKAESTIAKPIETPNIEVSEKTNETLEIKDKEETKNDDTSIPDSATIQEELDVIYSMENKLEGIFESTGLKEEKFVSFRDAATAEEREYTKFDFELESFPTKYLKQNICAGQVISFDGNLVIIGDCHEGCQISASGDITVWGDLSGSAYAGMNGNEKAKIRALRMNASQLRISNCYIKRPEALETPGLEKPVLMPEEAGIKDGEIGVYKIFK